MGNPWTTVFSDYNSTAVTTNAFYVTAANDSPYLYYGGSAPREQTNQEWLDERVNEMRVKL